MWPSKLTFLWQKAQTENHNFFFFLFKSAILLQRLFIPSFIDFWVCLSSFFFFIITIKSVSHNHYQDISFECKQKSKWTNLSQTIKSVFQIFQRLFPLLELSHMAYNWSHSFVYSIFINVSCMGYFPICSWPCIVLFNCYYIYLFFL